MNMKQLAIEALKHRPDIAQSPQGQEFLQILESGDDAKGQQMARNYCQSYGISEQDAIQKVRQFFNI